MKKTTKNFKCTCDAGIVKLIITETSKGTVVEVKKCDYCKKWYGFKMLQSLKEVA